jgi:hypothetical protein
LVIVVVRSVVGEVVVVVVVNKMLAPQVARGGDRGH